MFGRRHRTGPTVIVVEYLTGAARLLDGSRGFDEARTRAALPGLVFDRAASTATASAPATWAPCSPPSTAGRDGVSGSPTISVPTLVVHGDEDRSSRTAMAGAGRGDPRSGAAHAARHGQGLPRTVWPMWWTRTCTTVLSRSGAPRPGDVRTGASILDPDDRQTEPRREVLDLRAHRVRQSALTGTSQWIALTTSLPAFRSAVASSLPTSRSRCSTGSA